MSKRLRSIVREPRYERELGAIFESVPRADEAVRALEWTLCRLPELGMAVRGRPGYASWPLHTSEASFLVVYSFDEDKVVCLSIREIPAGVY